METSTAVAAPASGAAAGAACAVLAAGPCGKKRRLELAGKSGNPGGKGSGDDTDDPLGAAGATDEEAGGAEGPHDAALARLRRRVRELEAENARLVANAANSAAATLSPALYTVHAQRQVRCMRLGRTASIATRDELGKLSRAPGSPAPSSLEEFGLLERMNSLVRRGTLERDADFLGSEAFAKQLMELCERAKSVLASEPRVLEIASPMYIFGDLHGNLEDLQFFAEHVWPMGVRLSAGKLLFLGDYVDRGVHGLELLGYLLAQKVQAPDKVFMLRGNHETRTINGWEVVYGEGSFLQQCRRRFGDEIGAALWERCNEVFDCLPLAAVVDDSIFCVHGGIPSPTMVPNKSGKSGKTESVVVQDTRIEAIRRVRCPIDVKPPSPDEPEDADNKLAFSLLWADPADAQHETVVETSEDGFAESARGGGTMIFGKKAVHAFLEANKLDYIMRAHEATASGVAVCKSAKVLTVFSTSKDHGCGGDAQCGCFLVDRNRIQAITRAAIAPQPAPW